MNPSSFAIAYDSFSKNAQATAAGNEDNWGRLEKSSL
jgi:hypothetical protein